MSNTNRVHQAILNTIKGDGAYLLKTLASRTPAGADGSFFEGMTVETILAEMLTIGWELFTDPNVKAPAVGFQTYSFSHVGILGVIDVRHLPASTMIEFRDPKGTLGTINGGFQPYARLPLTRPLPTSNVATILLGPSETDSTKEIVWTIFPGQPVPYIADVPARPPMTVGEFRREFPGLTHVKYVREP